MRTVSLTFLILSNLAHKCIYLKGLFVRKVSVWASFPTHEILMHWDSRVSHHPNVLVFEELGVRPKNQLCLQIGPLNIKLLL